MSRSPVFDERPDLAELYGAILDNYYGLGATPRTMIEGLAEDLRYGRLTSDESLDSLGCTMGEMITTLGFVLGHMAQYAPDEMVEGYDRRIGRGLP